MIPAPPGALDAPRARPTGHPIASFTGFAGRVGSHGSRRTGGARSCWSPRHGRVSKRTRGGW